MQYRRALLLLLAAFVLAACGGDETATSSTTSASPSAVDQLSLDDDDGADEPTDSTPDADDDAPTTTEAPAETTTTVEETTTTEAPAEPDCVGPPADSLWWVDVSLDDPDGGLNLRTGPSTDDEILTALPRRSEVAATGVCADDGAWWEIAAVEGTTGWAASRYLSDVPVIHGGLGNAIADEENLGLEAEDLETLVELIAESYGHDEDLTVVEIDLAVADAVGGTGVWDTGALKDDASVGFRITIDFQFVKAEDDPWEIVGVRALRITHASICSRGLTDDGLCV